MTRIAHVPDSLTTAPFRGSAVLSAGTLSPNMLRSRVWVRLLPDVYAYSGLAVDHRLRCRALGLILPRRTAIGGPSAAHLWGANLLHPDPPVSVVAPRDGWMSRLPRVSTHHTVLGPEDVTELDGLPVTTPERTAFDVGRRLSRLDSLVLIDAMLHQGVLDAGAVMELARGRSRWPRIPLLRATMALADGRAESPMETRLRLLFHVAGLPAPDLQVEVHDALGRLVARVDLAWPAARLAVEYEGDHHRERDQFRRDIGRGNALLQLGWTVLRFTANDVIRCPRETVLAVRNELARRR
jgi:very-short-patch-repair endonuclease